MPGFILGLKSGSTQTFNDSGERIPVTFVKTTPNYLVGIMRPETHGYFAVQVGFSQTKNIAKPTLGKLTKAGVKTPLRFLREFRLDRFGNAVKYVEEGAKRGLAIGETKLFIGDEVKPSMLFQKGDLVDVSGTSKGKGFQGVVKRHHFAGGPRTHGQSDRERAPGSIGQTTTPGRVYRGKRMAGRMGGVRVTIRGLKVVDVKDDGILVKGLVPGANKGLVEVRKLG
jgi:large subunit ribosomal protein L3